MKSLMALRLLPLEEFMDSLSQLASFVLSHIPGLITLLIILGIGILYVQDRSQVDQTIRRNYPVIGRFRYFFEDLGVFFRQYFFALDREEMPFNRADRSWAYRAAKRESTLQAFGSTRVQHEGDVVFANAVIPFTGESSNTPLTFGPECRAPYTTDRRFHISGMSYGAISKPAVTALALGAKQAGIWINTGEGGASDAHLESGADLVCQIGTAKYGVRTADGHLDPEKLKSLAARESVKMFEIKISQGAKPGKGGILPADKVTPEIAAQRGIPVGEASISPPGHEEINSASDLFDFIHQVRELTGKPTGFKICIGNMDDFRAVLEVLVVAAQKASESVAADQSKQVFEAYLADYAPDFITLDSGNGGTGAAPMSLIDAAGMNIQESLPSVVNLLTSMGLRERIRVVASGKLITPVDVAWALCAGADCVTSARGFMFSLGCIQALQCHQNTCPTGITTHNNKLQRGLDAKVKSNRVANYANEMHAELDTIAHSCGAANASMLNRSHALIFVGNQRAVSMTQVYAGDLTHEK